MTGAKIIIGGEEHSLFYNGQAMFSIKAEFGEESNMLAAISPTSADGFAALCKVAVILAEQGELLRRYEGHSARDLLTEGALRLILTPMETLALFNAVMSAVMLAYGREVKDEEGIDEVLAELQKKTETG